MVLYLQNLIPRLRQYSDTLARKELFLEKPWVMLDEKGNHQKYIFKGNGELVMSLNGAVSMGRWEYLAAAKSLLIDRIEDKILLNQTFIDPGVMILNQDGASREYFILSNENIILDHDILKYLRQIHQRHRNILYIPLKDGRVLEVHNYVNSIFNNDVTIDAENVSDCRVESANSERTFVIKSGKIRHMFAMESYGTDRGAIVIEKDILVGSHIAKGYRAFQDGASAADGKYKINFFYSIHVKDGIVVKA